MTTAGCKACVAVAEMSARRNAVAEMSARRNAVKRGLVLFCLLLSSLTAFSQIKIVPQERLDSVARPSLAANAESLCFERLHWDAGTLNESDAPKQIKVGFANQSDQDLLIRKIMTTCSCVQVRCDKSVVKAGESATLTMTYSPAGHIGGFVYRVFVYTDQYDKPSAILKLSARVLSD